MAHGVSLWLLCRGDGNVGKPSRWARSRRMMLGLCGRGSRRGALNGVASKAPVERVQGFQQVGSFGESAIHGVGIHGDGMSSEAHEFVAGQN